jgi:hypothetical protein
MLRKQQLIIEIIMKDIIRQSLSRLPFGRKWLSAAAGVTAAILLALLVPARPVQAENQQLGSPFTLVGSWVTEVGVAPGPKFTAYETFTEGAGSVEINNGPGGSTTGIGTWTRIGHRKFLATLFRQQFDNAGNIAATIKVRRLILLSQHGNEFTGTDNVDLFDPAGNPIPANIPPGTFHGTRIVAEQLTR